MIMGKYIQKVGGLSRAEEIVKFHKEYFRNYTHYDSVKKSFCKAKKDHGNPNLVFMNFLIGELRREHNKVVA